MGKQQSIKSFFRPTIEKEGKCKDISGFPVVGEDRQLRESGSVVPVVDVTGEDELHNGRSLAVASDSDNRLRHDKWQAKLLGKGNVMGRRWGGKAAGGTTELDKSGEHTTKEKKKELTPLEQQVVELQEKYHPDCVLVIECGYKYRFFGRDAEIANNVLGIFSYVEKHFLTASVPTNRIQYHVRRLVSAGYKVGIVRQVETAAIKNLDKKTKSQPFKRELTELCSPATIECSSLGGSSVHVTARDVEEGDSMSGSIRTYSSEQASSFLVCLVEHFESTSSEYNNDLIQAGIVAIECSTGNILQSNVQDGHMRSEIESRLLYAKPSDLLVVTPISINTRRLLDSYCKSSSGVKITEVDGSRYANGGYSASLTKHFCPVSKIETRGDDEASERGYHNSPMHKRSKSILEKILDMPQVVGQALAHSLDYLAPFGLDNLIQLPEQIVDFSEVQEMSLSPNCIEQLEILRNSDDGAFHGSLLWLLDKTQTRFGARLLRRWVCKPLKDANMIEERLYAVEEIIESASGRCRNGILSRLPAVLSSMPDLERSLSRIVFGSTSPSELLEFLDTFRDLSRRLNVKAKDGNENGMRTVDVSSIESSLLQYLIPKAVNQSCSVIALNILNTLNIDACKKDDLIHVFGNSEKYESVFERQRQVECILSQLQDIKPVLASSLGLDRVDYVSLQNQGEYLIEIPTSMEKRIPSTWIKVSSTKKMLRYHAPEVVKLLAELEVAREYRLLSARQTWNNLLKEICCDYESFRSSIQALSALDCLNSFALVSTSRGDYTKPTILTRKENNGPIIRIVQGRHPVLEVLQEGNFMPNTTCLGNGSEICQIITGPNMGGKSCYIKQTAIIAICAQIGCFVPAKECIISPFDAIFTRMGAADSIALGRSTFLEELGEMASILHHATPNSLVVCDELGRGTSTKQGLAIAGATLRYLCKSIGCATLFVTHYPEIAIESHLMDSGTVCSHYMDYVLTSTDKEPLKPPQVIFLYTLKSGVAESSYGLNVARMSGLPDSVIHAASRISKGVPISSEDSLARSLHQLTIQTASNIDKESLRSMKKSLESLQRFISSTFQDC
eukprot:jgi/Picsp_1/2537/NSC_00768-R1_dna mismatch repair protein